MSDSIRSSRDAHASWIPREDIFDRFDAAWSKAGAPAIADFLPAIDSAERRPILLELIKIDLEHRWTSGQAMRIEEYALSFPELTQDGSLPADLLVEEINVRRDCGVLPSAAELKQRFGEHVPPSIQDLLVGCPPTPDGSCSDASQTVEGAAAKSAPALNVPIPERLGRYDVLEPIGRGGFATVYRGWDRELHREVALKVPRVELFDGPEVDGRFLREARAAAKLRHPAIVPLHEVGQEGSVTYLVYDYVPGQNLAQVLKRTQPAADQAAQWVARIADALDYAHQSGIIHRDVKPANILMDRDGQPVLSDFGLASHKDAGPTLTQDGDILGTPAYMSPEQARGANHEVDGRTDVYSLGVLLYEALAGSLPFQGQAASILHKVLNEEPRSPRGHRPSIPADLETICLKAMAKEPGRRYRTAGDFAEDLRRHLRHEPILARRIGPVARLARWCRRKPALAATIAIAVVAVSLIGGFSAWTVLEERDRFRNERDKAQANLYRALVSDTQAQFLARDTGWWWKAMNNIRDAAKLEVAGKDVKELRELAVEAIASHYGCLRQQQIWDAHPTALTALALSPDERLLATGGRDNAVRLWSFPDGKAHALLAGHQRPITSVAFHPLGRFLASTSQDGTLCLWDLQAAPESAGGAKVVAQLPIRHQLAVAKDSITAAFSPDGRFLAVGSTGGTIHIAATHDLTAQPSFQTPMITAKSVTCLTFSPDGRTLATGDAGRMVRLWDVIAREQTLAWNAGQTPASLAYSPDSDILAWSDVEGFGYGFRRMHDGKIVSHLRVHGSRVNQIIVENFSTLTTISADGSLIISGHKNFETRYDLAVARVSGAGANGFAMTRDGAAIVAGYADGKVRVWERLRQPQRDYVDSNCQSLAFLGKSRTVVDNLRAIPLNMNQVKEYRPAVTAVAIQPGGRLMAWSDAAGGLFVRDHAAPEQAVKTLDGLRKFRCLAADAGGRILASGSEDGAIELWDWQSGQRVLRLDQDLGAVAWVCWNADDRYLAAVAEQGVFLWDGQESWKRRRLADQRLRGAAVALGKDLLALSSLDQGITIRTLADGAVARTLRGHASPVTALRFFADGKHLASAGEGEAVRLWDVAAGKELGVIEGAAKPAGRLLILDPQERYLVTGVGRGVLVGDVRAQKQIGTMTCADNPSAQFLPDGSGFISAGFDGSVRLNTVHQIEATVAAAQGSGKDKIPTSLLTIQNGKVLVPGGNSDHVWAMAASPDGRWFAAGCHDGTAHLWDAATFKKVRSFGKHSDLVWHVAFSADSKYLASAAPEIKIWDLATGTEKWNWTAHTRLVRGVAFHPTRPLVASASSDGAVRLWNVDSGESLGVLHQFSKEVANVAFHPKGTHLAAACMDGTVAVWDLVENISMPMPPTRLLKGHPAGVWAVAFHPEGRYLASGSAPGTILLWDPTTWAKVVTLKADNGEIRSLNFSSDGELLVGGAYVNRGIVWDLPQLRRSLQVLGLDW